jgi:hypothetical protein
MKPILSVVLLSSTFAAGAAYALDGYPPPAGVVAVRLGAGVERLWPFTGTDFSGVPSDPINLVFLGDADPRIVRQTLLALDGDRTAFGLPNVFPLNCTWSDAIGKNQTAYARSEGWQGSAIQLQCGAYSVIRFHLRLFREGKRTLGNAHFEVMIPGTTDHEALSQEFAEAFVKLDLMRSGALEGPPSETAQISPAPSFGTIRPEIFNGVLPFIAPLLPLLGLPTTPQSAPIPVPSNGKASVFHLEGSVSREPTAIRIEFEHPFNQTIPKPFCSSGPLDYLKVQGPLHMVQEVHIDDLGRYSTRFETAGVLDVTPVNPLTGQPTGPSYQAVVGETHLSSLSLHRSEAHNTVMQTLLSETPQSNFENFWAGDIDHFVLIADCGP